MKELTKEQENFTNRCYDAYCLDWMISHGLSVNSIFDVIRECFKEMAENDDADLQDMNTAVDAADDYLFERGFKNDCIYACKNEFMDIEFMDESYMRGLFKAMGNYNELLKQYHEIKVLLSDNDNEGKEYIVSMAVDGRIDIPVYLEKVPEDEKDLKVMVKEAAQINFGDTDCGDLEVVGFNPVNFEDANGNFNDF